MIKIKISSLGFILLVCIFSFNGIAHAFPKNSLRPGGIAVINILPSNQAKPYVSYNSSPVALVKGQQNWLAVVGIPLKSKAGTHKVSIKKASGEISSKSFRVKSGLLWRYVIG